MEFVESGDSDDHGNRDGNGDGSSGGNDEHHGGIGRVYERGSNADGDGGGAAVGNDLGGDEFNRGRTDRRVHSDRTL